MSGAHERYAKGWDESEHPRADNGQFSSGGGSGGGSGAGGSASGRARAIDKELAGMAIKPPDPARLAEIGKEIDKLESEGQDVTQLRRALRARRGQGGSLRGAENDSSSDDRPLDAKRAPGAHALYR